MVLTWVLKAPFFGLLSCFMLFLNFDEVGIFVLVQKKHTRKLHTRKLCNVLTFGFAI